MKDEKKIAFIICINDDLYFNEYTYYINRLIVSEGYTIDIIKYTEAECNKWKD